VIGSNRRLPRRIGKPIVQLRKTQHKTAGGTKRRTGRFGLNGPTSTAFEQDGVIYEQGGVKVVAFTVDHGPAIKPAVGYRIEYEGRSVVISSDSRYNQNVIKYGTAADVLIHELCVARPELLSTNVAAQRFMAHHTSPQELGKCSRRRARSSLCILIWFSPRTISAPAIEDIVAQTRETHEGPLAIGEDLMSFEIGDSVTVHREKQ
jgi:ribonuclease Z